MGEQLRAVSPTTFPQPEEELTYLQELRENSTSEENVGYRSPYNNDPIISPTIEERLQELRREEPIVGPANTLHTANSTPTRNIHQEECALLEEDDWEMI